MYVCMYVCMNICIYVCAHRSSFRGGCAYVRPCHAGLFHTYSIPGSVLPVRYLAQYHVAAYQKKSAACLCLDVVLGRFY